MAGLAVASLVQTGLDLDWVAHSQAREVGFILISVPFVLQLVACVISLLARDTPLSAAIGVLATTWLATGLLHVISGHGGRIGALGLLQLSAGAMVLLSALAIAQARPLPGAVLAMAATRFAISGVHELGGSHSWQTIAGWLGVAITVSCGYCVLAFDLEDLSERPRLPTFRRDR